MSRVRAAVSAGIWAAILTLAPHGPARAQAPPAGTPAPGTSARPTDRSYFGRGYYNSVPMRVRIAPAPARLGQSVTYHGMVLVPPSVHVQFEPPQSGGSLTWSHVRAGREKRGWLQNVTAGFDSVWFEARLQVFDTGPVAIPGPVVQLNPRPGTVKPGSTRLPTVHLVVLPTITAADSNAELRALHGPLGAPWWERVPWSAVIAGLLLVVALGLLVRALRRRPRPRPGPRAAPSIAPSRPRLDPAAEALRALAALRARALPAEGRFGEHALELTAILRRFLEGTITTPRPGDTSGELLERLRTVRMEEADLERLEGLLALWDRVKFARAPLTEAEAKRCEDAVESYVRRVAQARFEAVAAAARAAAARASSKAPGAPSAPGGAPPPPPAPEAA